MKTQDNSIWPHYTCSLCGEQFTIGPQIYRKGVPVDYAEQLKKEGVALTCDTCNTLFAY